MEKKQKKLLIFGFTIGIIIAGIFFVTRDTEEKNISKDNSGISTQNESYEKAPNFSFKNYSGKTVSLSDFSGTPIIINSWASWCSFCKQELPDFVEIQKEFEKDVVFIAINRGESIEKARAFTDSENISEEIIFLLDPKDSFYKSIGGIGMPETLFVNTEGDIVEHKRGVMTLEEAREKTKHLISL